MSTLKSRARARRMASSQKVIDASITNIEILSAQDFVRIMNERPEEIESSVFCPPSIGDKSFGSFRVKFLKPRLVTS